MQLLLVNSNYRITWLQYTYRSPTLNAAYVFKLYLQNYWFLPHLAVPYFNWNVSLYNLLKKSLAYTTLMGVQYYMQPMFVSSTYRTTGLQYTYRSPTFSAGYVCKLYLHLTSLMDLPPYWQPMIVSFTQRVTWLQ